MRVLYCMLVNTGSYNGGACLIHLRVCRNQKGRVAYQIKLAPDTVHFDALYCCACINGLELKQFDRAYTLDFYVHLLIGLRTVLWQLNPRSANL